MVEEMARAELEEFNLMTPVRIIAHLTCNCGSSEEPIRLVRLSGHYGIRLNFI